MRHQSPLIEPADSFAELKLFPQPLNALDAVLWHTDDGDALPHLLKGQPL